MPKVQNTFLKGKMDSDTNYSLIGNDTYVRAENVRISGEGNDGAFKTLKGSQLVSEQYAESGGVIIGAYEGINNKMYFFIALSNKKSKIVEYDVEAQTSRLVISDNQFLRFDLIRWNAGVEIYPYRYLLGVNQVGKYLLISDRVWRYPRIIDLEKDYSSGFTEQEIILNKKPPFLSPIISNKVLDTTISDEEAKNVFVSFAYRYKYQDGIYSALSFYTEASFETQINKSLDDERKNEGMENRYNKLSLIVNTGTKDVTDVEVYAREHNSNTAYLIYSANKAKKSLTDNTDITIDYTYSKNYEILGETETKEMFSSVPMFPNSQEQVGNRMFYVGSVEGFDLIDKDGNPILVDYEVEKVQEDYVAGGDNKTAVSLFSYKVAPVFFNDYNIATTALLPTDQAKSEVNIDFADRTKVNKLQVKLPDTFKAPEFATKLKFVVRSEPLNYELIYPNIIKKVGNKLYIKLDDANVNKVKEGDYIIPVSTEQEYKEYYVDEVRVFTKDEGYVSESGLYAVIKIGTELEVIENIGTDVKEGIVSLFGGVNTATVVLDYAGTVDDQDFINNEGHRCRVYYSLFGALQKGSYFDLFIQYTYGDVSSSDSPISNSSIKPFSTVNPVIINQQIYAERDYANIGELIKEKFTDYRFTLSEGTAVIGGITQPYLQIDTNESYADYCRDVLNNIFYMKLGSINLAVRKTGFIKLKRGFQPITFRTKNKNNTEEVFFYETSKTYQIINGNIIADDTIGTDKIFDINFYNGYSWGDGTESYKIRDEFNANSLNFNFRGTAYEINGYKAKYRNDITWSGKYNETLGINQLGNFNATEINWKEVPLQCGIAERLISSDNNLTIYCENKVALAMYEKSILYDMNGVETVSLSDQVLGAVSVLDYEYGVGKNPESVVKAGGVHYFIDPKRKRFLIKQGNQIQEINPIGSGFFSESQKLLTQYKSFLATYDDKHDEYLVGFDHQLSLGFNMNYKGFTQFYTNAYEYLHSMNGKLFTAHNGKLYQNEVTTLPNNLVGQGVFKSKVKFVCNPQIDSDKVFKAMYLQSNYAWDIEAKTNLTSTKFSKNAFDKRESFFYTNIYGDNATNKGIVGIGNVVEITADVLKFGYEISNAVNIGDELVNNVTNAKSKIVNISGKYIEVENGALFNVGDYCYTEQLKVGYYRPNGVPMRGQWLEYTLSLTPTEETYLTSVYTEVIKSNL